MLRSLLVLLLAAPLAAPAVAQVSTVSDTLRLSLEAAVQRALAVSPEVATVAAQRDFAEARFRFARANRLLAEATATGAGAVAPGLDVPADNPYPDEALYLNPDVRNDWTDLSPFGRLEFELLQPLWTWGELGGSIRAARHGVEVEAAEVRGKALEVALRTGELYYGLLLADALERLTGRAGDIVDQAEREIQRLLSEGADDVDDADLFQLQITKQEYNRRVVEVVERRATARTALRRQLLLGAQAVAPEADELTPLPFTLDSLDVYLALALEHRPELHQAEAGLAARDALVRVARSDYYPKLFARVDGRYSFVQGRERQPNPYVSDPFLGRSLRAGIGFRQKLDFVQTRAEVAQAEAERDEVRYQLEAAEQLVLFEVEEAYRNLRIARAALLAQTEAFRLTREWMRSEQINFDLDIGDTENLVNAVRASLQQEAAYYEAVQRHNVAVLRLLAAAGVLVRNAESGTLVD